jgi:hypothetical protein
LQAARENIAGNGFFASSPLVTRIDGVLVLSEFATSRSLGIAHLATVYRLTIHIWGNG